MRRAVNVALAILFASALFLAPGRCGAQSAQGRGQGATPKIAKRSVTNAMRQAAAARAAESKSGFGPLLAPRRAPVPGGTPDYFNYPNYANSPQPTVVGGVATGGGIHKFVNTLPGLGYANRNNLNQYIPIAVADAAKYPGSDYYQIGLVDYTQKLHTDLPATKLRGYKDLQGVNSGGSTDTDPHYLGPLIIAHRGTPVRIKFVDQLGQGSLGDLFLPVDVTMMGAGMGPDGMNSYTQNRATIHLHGGDTPWISDGTPYQWITPAGDPTPYKKGVSQKNVPDMDAPGDGAATFFYPNQQSARLMFYHDHAVGLTRLNVYAGEAAAYLLTDTTEENLISSGFLPDAGGVYHYGIPLVIQDKTFVDSDTIAAQDPTWNWGSTPGTARTGDLWYNHVYVPNQDPSDPSGVNAMGRWDYGPWTWPPLFPAHGANLDGTPGVPHPSAVPESYMDTPVVNGTPYPRLTVDRKAYRFRILNACNDRFLNLQLYYADAGGTEVHMVPAVFNSTYPATWPADVRDGGVPAPETAGPPLLQIGTEGGFLPGPVTIPANPISADLADHGLFLATAERADVIIDFSAVPAGSKLILYNDSFAPVPGSDSRYDYYTGDPDQTAIGGATTTVAGYGANTRTIMRFDVTAVGGAPGYNAGGLAAALRSAYAVSKSTPIVPETAYNAAFGTSDVDTFARISDNSLTFVKAGSTVTVALQSKSLNGGFETDYGRLTAQLGTANSQTVIPLGYIDAPTDIFKNGETQIWKLVNNDMDVHAMHFHLFNVQLVNRVAFGGQITPPEPNELGWKDTVKTRPGEDTIVALQPIASTVPFAVQDSVRLLNPAMPEGASWQSLDPVTNQPVTVYNQMTNFGWEYVWHCHILGHEENDMMRPMVLRMGPGGTLKIVSISPASAASGTKDVTLTLAGEEFYPGCMVRLTRAGQPSVEASMVSVAGTNRLTATFHQPFATGMWNVTLLGGGQTVTVPSAFALLGATPNSAKIYQGVFKPLEGEAAQLNSSMGIGGNTTIRVYDILGRKVRELVNGGRSAGSYVDTWDGRNDNGTLVASGMYLVRFENPSFNTTKRVVVVK